MSKFMLTIFILGFTLLGCEENCKDVACFTPPNKFTFELTDKETGENLFTNETFDASEIRIVDLEDNSSLDFTFIDENNHDLLIINSIGWETEQVTASINIGEKPIFDIVVDAEVKNENCCISTQYNEVKIENSEFELNTENGIYNILVAQ